MVGFWKCGSNLVLAHGHDILAHHTKAGLFLVRNFPTIRDKALDSILLGKKNLDTVTEEK